VPSGLQYVPGSGSGFQPERGQHSDVLVWSPGDLSASQVLTGTFQARLTGVAVGETVTSTFSVTASSITETLTTEAIVDGVGPLSERAWSSHRQAAWLRSPDGRVALRIPPGATKNRTEFIYREHSQLDQIEQTLATSFALEAQDETGATVRVFGKPLSLRVNYPSPASDPAILKRLTIGYYDEIVHRWVPVPSDVALTGHTLQAKLSHFTAYGIMTADGSVPALVDRMSDVRGAQAELYTRSIAYGKTLEMPPGRGGLSPYLALNYNSANHTQVQGHYSYVGHGWELAGADYIFRDPNTISDYDPTAGDITMVLGGRHYTLKSYRGNDNQQHYFVKEDPTIRVEYSELNDETWSEKTPTGELS
jgi:hypothetical protein